MLKHFFIFASGADRDILATCPDGEQSKYAGIGATVFFTAVFAAIACSYALFTVFDSIWIATFFGLLWGLLIFNLDRYIVATIRKRENFSNELIQALPRLALAVIIAIVISKPLELKIFEKEIDQVLLEQKNDLTLANQEQIALQYNPKIAQIDAEINGINTAIATKEVVVNELYDTYIAEAEGTAGTELLGKGPVYQEKRDKHDAQLAVLTQMKIEAKETIAGLEAEKLAIEQQYIQQVTASQPVIDRFDGLMARVMALDQLPWLPSFFIFLLFLAVETSPILAKLISTRSAYDLKLEQEEDALKTWVAQQKHAQKVMLTTDQDLNNRIFTDISREDELYHYKRKKARQLMQLQADAFHRKQSKALS